MKILEFEAKTLLSNQGLPVPPGNIADSPEQAAALAQSMGGAVAIKAQIPAGGRMKAGGISFADTPKQVQIATAHLLNKKIHNLPVTQVLVEKKLSIAHQIFIGATYNTQTRRMVLLASQEGGIDIEANKSVVEKSFSALTLMPDYLGREIAAELGFEGRQMFQLAAIIAQIGRCFARWDALLLEINPLVLTTQGQWWLADVHLELDDDAIYRQAELLRQFPHSLRWTLQKSDFEQQAANIDQANHRGVAGRLVPFNGNLGLLIGGGGASLTIFDAVLNAGLKPANYCEIGGNPSVWKIKELTKLILSQPQVDRLAVIMNVVSNTRVDLVARGVIKGVIELGLDPQQVIAAFRIPGSWENEGQAILRHYGIPFFGRDTTIDRVVETIK